MSTTVAHEANAAARLVELGLEYEQLERALLRADAEAKLTSDLEPPTAEGITRYNKTNRFLREELVPAGWRFDNSQNFCRTIDPSGTFAIVASSGDEGAGTWVPGHKPSTKYSKGETAVRAVAANTQPALDLGEEFADEPVVLPAAVWYLLYRVTSDHIFVELSLPSAIEGGRIVDWSERIILDPIERAAASLDQQLLAEGGDEEYPVNVVMR